ncbi:hypothetical protein Bca4012_052688 [Brassica carinata]
MGITLKHELIAGSYKTIDGRGTSVEITGHWCLTIQKVSHVIIHNVRIHHYRPSGNTLVASSPQRTTTIETSPASLVEESTGMRPAVFLRPREPPTET